MKCMAYFILDFIVFMVQSNLFLWRLVWLIHSLWVGSVLTLLLTSCYQKIVS
jgi:hypothetical protein